MDSQSIDINKEEDLLLFTDTLVDMLDSGLLDSDKRLELSTVREKISNLKNFTILNHSMIVFEKLKEASAVFKDRGYGFKSIDNIRSLKFIRLDIDDLVDEPLKKEVPSDTFTESNEKSITSHLESCMTMAAAQDHETTTFGSALNEAIQKQEKVEELPETSLQQEEVTNSTPVDEDSNEPLMNQIVELIDKGIIPLNRPIKLTEFKKILKNYGFNIMTPPNLAITFGSKLKTLGEKHGYVFNVGSKKAFGLFRRKDLIELPNMVSPMKVETFVAKKLGQLYVNNNAFELETEYNTTEILSKISSVGVDDSLVTKKQFKDMAPKLNDELVEFGIAIIAGQRGHAWNFIKHHVPEEYRKKEEVASEPTVEVEIQMPEALSEAKPPKINLSTGPMPSGQGGDPRLDRIERMVEKLAAANGFRVRGLEEHNEVLETVELGFLKDHLNTMNTVIQESGMWFTLSDANNGWLSLNGPKKAVLESVYSMKVDVDIITSIIENKEDVICFDWDFKCYNNLVGALKFVDGIVKHVKCS